MTQNNQDRLSDLIYITSPAELEAAILSERHTADELSGFVEEFERNIHEINAEISLLDSERVEMCARLRVLLKMTKQIK